MPYDRHLADRVRAALAGTPGLAERPMFGGLAFLVGGNLAVAVRSAGGLLVRVGAADAENLERSADVERARMGSRVMKDWLHVPADGLRSDADLVAWVRRGVTHAGRLPAKGATPRSRRD